MSNNKTTQAHITIYPKDKTSYKFTQQEVDEYYNIINDKLRAYIIQGEYTKDKKEHLQIYAQFIQQQRYAAIKKIFNNNEIHIEPIKYGKVEDCIRYCTSDYRDKDGQPKDIWKESKQIGDFKIQGQRTDIENMIDRIKSGERLNKIIIEEPKAARLYMQYSKGFREVENIIRQSNINEELKEEYKDTIWRQWQKELLEYVDKPTDKRKIRWIYETTGNTGKSYITKYLTLFKDAYVVTGGKKEDILYAYDGQETIIFDLPRDFKKDKEYIYEVMEILKNGQYLSTKYQTVMKTFKIPKIIVMANFEPDYNRLSKDRYDVVNLTQDNVDTAEAGGGFQRLTPIDNEDNEGTIELIDDEMMGQLALNDKNKQYEDDADSEEDTDSDEYEYHKPAGQRHFIKKRIAIRR